MNFRKYERFIKSHQYRVGTGEIVVMVNCAYEKDKKALFEIGTLEELESLMLQLEKMKTFVLKSQKLTENNSSERTINKGQTNVWNKN